MTNNYKIKNPPFLKRILWLDFFLGSSTAIGGLIFSRNLSTWLGLGVGLIISISIITLLYSFYALWLAKTREISVSSLRMLVYANWIWTAISIVLLGQHYTRATPAGLLYLVLQILVVGGLAYMEGIQIKKTI